MLTILNRLSIFFMNCISRDLDNKKYFYKSFSFGTWLSNLHVFSFGTWLLNPHVQTRHKILGLWNWLAYALAYMNK